MHERFEDQVQLRGAEEAEEEEGEEGGEEGEEEEEEGGYEKMGERDRKKGREIRRIDGVLRALSQEMKEVIK